MQHKRPLSPHLQIYKPQLTSVLSITHRATGVFLALGAIMLTLWLTAIASGPQYYMMAMDYITGVFGKLILFGLTFALSYHLGNGIRHLVWDAGFGFELRQVYITGWVVVATSLTATLLIWGLAI